MLNKINIKPYYKTRIIITFCIITTVIVIILSRTGYLFIKDIYLTQLADQANIVTGMLSKQIEPGYLNLLEIGNPTGTTEDYFKELFKKNLTSHLHSEIFIFDKDLNIIIHSNPAFLTGQTEPRLQLNKKEITGLKINSGTASLPFKGNDNKWYLWGFYRLNNTYYLAVRESASRFNLVDELSSLFWYLSLGGIIISVIVSWLLANAITRPLDKLIAFSSEIGKGNFKATPPAEMHGEIKMLADSMDKMKNDLAVNQVEREKLLAQIAHEIRNPLGGIMLLVNLIKENQQDFEKNNEYLNRILEDINGLKILITSYLNYSRPVPVTPSWVNLDKLTQEVENIFKSSIKTKNILFVKNIEIDKIYFDEGHLKQILINLIANSLDAVDDNGTIIITANEEPRWEIVVSDDGEGINGPDYENIFNPFFTTKKNGTGLGLAICRKLCSENNAILSTVQFDNHKINNNGNKGASFIITKDKIYEG